MVRFGDLYRMATGEEVVVTRTRCYATPQGDTLQHAVKLVRGHAFQCTREVGERVIHEQCYVNGGTTFHLTNNELLNNGTFIGRQDVRRAA